MKSKGIWAIVSVLVALGLVLASCAKAPEAPAAPTTPAAPTPAAPTPAAPAPAAPQVIKWKAQELIPPAPPWPERFPWGSDEMYGKDLMAWVEKATNGRLIIERAPAGSIVPEAQVLKAVRDNVLQATEAWSGFYTGIHPEFLVTQGIPFNWTEPGHVSDWLYNFGGYDIMREVYAEDNIWPIITTSGCLQGLGAKGLATSPTWFKGKKVRAAGVWQKFAENLGGSGVLIPYPEMYMAIKLGTVDGYIASSQALEGVKLKEVLDSYVTAPNQQCYALEFIFNKDALNALPADIKAILMRDMEPFILWHSTIRSYNQTRARLFKAETDGHIKLLQWTGEDAQMAYDAGFKTWDWVASQSPRTAKLIEISRKQMRAYGFKM